MESLLHQRRIAIWELICQNYKIPKARLDALDALIRLGEEIPPKLTKKE
jgi:hypothetical protein